MSKKDIRKEVILSLREQFVPTLKEAMREKFELEIDTSYNIISGSFVSSRNDNEPFTPEQHSFIAGYEAAWLAASHVTSDA